MASPPDTPAHRSAQRFLTLRSQDQICAAAGSPLPGWRFSRDPSLVRVLDHHLQHASLPARPRRAFAALAPAAALPTLDPVESDKAHYAVLWAAGAAAADDSPTLRARADLARLGRWVDWYGRGSWRTVAYSENASKDLDVAGLWAAWASGDCWSGRGRWEDHFLDSTVRVFRSVAAARELPADVAERAVSDLREAFFFRMIGGSPAGWTEVAARVLETAPPDPISAVHASLSPKSRSRAALCLTCRGSWRSTVALVFPDLVEPLARARALAGPDDAAPHWDALLDLHCALRLVRSWGGSASTGSADAQGSPRSDYTVLTQNRGRARGRLRAVLAGQDTSTILSHILSLDRLHARTDAALRRFAWAWAWQELAYDFSFDLHRAVTPACPPTATTMAPLSADDLEALQTWVLLVIYRGRLAHLRRWVGTGSTGDRDSAWARLLSNALPDALRDPPVAAARAATYRRVRAELSFSLDGILRGLATRVRATADLAPGRTLKSRFMALHAPSWHQSVPILRSGFPTARAAAHAALPLLNATWEAPDHGHTDS